MRSYSSLLVLENVFDSLSANLPSLDNSVQTLYRQVFYPLVPLTEDTCSTLLGEKVSVSFNKVGLLELYTGDRLTPSITQQLLEEGVYLASVRNTSTCIATGGVCHRCVTGSFGLQEESGTSLQPIRPNFVKFEEYIQVGPSQQATLGLASDEYTRVDIWGTDGHIDPSLYSVSGTTITFSPGASTVGGVAVRYSSETLVPYLLWLAKTYSGSVLGVGVLDGPKLPVRQQLLESLIDTSVVSSVIGLLPGYGAPQDQVDYAKGIHGVLEQALFVLALTSVYTS